METLFIGKNSLFLLEVESTNTYAMNLLRNVNAIEGTIVFTDNQTQGKGQRGAVWSSNIAQNITVSIILKPQFLDIDKTFYLSKISALAVYDVLSDILVDSQYDIKIKWPNDILVNRQKIAGILIENNFTKTYVQNTVIGIGLNVNQHQFSDFERAATSINILTNKEFDRNTVMKMLFWKLEKWYLKLKERKFDIIDSNYMKYLLGINEVLSFEDVGKCIFDAKLVGVSKSGKLMLQLGNSEIREFDVKELKFLN